MKSAIHHWLRVFLNTLGQVAAEHSHAIWPPINRKMAANRLANPGPLHWDRFFFDAVAGGLPAPKGLAHNRLASPGPVRWVRFFIDATAGGLCAFEELAHNGARPAPPASREFPSCMAARVRALCAPKEFAHSTLARLASHSAAFVFPLTPPQADCALSPTSRTAQPPRSHRPPFAFLASPQRVRGHSQGSRVCSPRTPFCGLLLRSIGSPHR